MSEDKLETIFECAAYYFLKDVDRKKIEEGNAQVSLDEENIIIAPKFSEALKVHFRDILTISEKSYKISMFFISGGSVIISKLAYQHDDFLRILKNLRNQLFLKDMLMNDSLKKSGLTATLEHLSNDGKSLYKGKCEPRLYETSLIIIFDELSPMRLPHCDIVDIKAEDFMLVIKTEFNGMFIFSKMGKKYDSFIHAFSEQINELSIETQTALKDFLPKLSPLVIRQAARFMKDGKAAKRSDLEKASPTIWVELEKKINRLGVKDEYEFLKSFAQEEKMSIGIKRGLLGDLTGEYIWFLIPMYNIDTTILGNAVAMEAISSEGGGKATYFFKILNREDYKKIKNIEDLDNLVDDYIQTINSCMLAINFRREPIYLADEKLDDPMYEKYKVAVARIPELRILRKLFIGRVIHSSFKQWKEDVNDLLKFNVTSKDEEKWEKKRS